MSNRKPSRETPADDATTTAPDLTPQQEIDAALAAYALPLSFTPAPIANALADLVEAARSPQDESAQVRAASTREWLARVQRGEVQLTDCDGKPLPVTNPSPTGA